MANINTMSPKSGRILQEDNTVINVADGYAKDPDDIYIQRTVDAAPFAYDENEDCYKVIDIVHEHIHEGNHFVVSKLFTSVANDANADLRILAGAKKNHIIATVSAEGKAYSYLYSGTAYSGNGTAVTVHNNNLANANTTSSTAYHTPTVGTLGTAKREMLINGGIGGQTVSGVHSGRIEWIQSTSTDLLFRVTNKAGTAKDISINLEFYEVD